jgi:hypothetical protein
METELNEAGLLVVTSMFRELELHGSRAAKELRERHYQIWGRKNVNEAARAWMRQRQQEFGSVPLWCELREATNGNFPFAKNFRAWCRLRRSRRRAERSRED